MYLLCCSISPPHTQCTNTHEVLILLSNTLALKAEPHWPFYEHGPADYRAFKAVHVALLRSSHRTTDPRAADYFYVPTWDLHGSWGNPEIYWR